MSSHDVDRIPASPVKKLRFITTQGAPNPKRRRVTAACLTCRRRKIACSGEQPVCDTCALNKLDCLGYSSSAQKSATRDARKDAGSNARLRHEETGEALPTGIIHDLAPTRQSPRQSDDLHDCHSFIKAEPSGPPAKQNEPLHPAARNRMPYFRWLGPTAIMPGFKQMVVKIRQPDSSAPTTDEGAKSPSSSNVVLATSQYPSTYSATPKPVDSDIRTPLSLPFYDTSSMPPSELITHLCETFFTHLGCNFPFLQKARFLDDLEEKQVDAILVDAVCALAARFSTHHLLAAQFTNGLQTMPSEYGQAFAQRAKAALVDAYSMPTVAAVQAALLLAYNEFGESRDSGLWMYLGISIRLAQDLGLQKVQGLRYEGRDGPTPKAVKLARDEKATLNRHSINNDRESTHVDYTSKEVEEQRAVERERVDTFWSVFFLDRVVSSGTGRRSTLRDNDIELSFPALECPSSDAGWPTPFPALIRIVHLYGRVADLLNGIKEPSDITTETTRRLSEMEARVTNFYQGLSPRLHFEAMNFHHYVKAGQGTNFVLLHFWFHTLIVLLHQPTLLKTFEGQLLQLFPNSQQLSMASAKTIADILSYSQLIDTKAGLGNPFTTQPIYIAACAFLKETAERTATSAQQSQSQSRCQSRATSPGRSNDKTDSCHSDSTSTTPGSSLLPTPSGKPVSDSVTERSVAKHTLLATAASQHYQLCYHALESIERYWAGTKYILTVLDQKFKGVGDPLLYTDEEGLCSMEQPKPEPVFTSPGWRRSVSSSAAALANHQALNSFRVPFLPGETEGKSSGPPVSGHNKAIGWTLTGTLNSPSTNLAWHYPNAGNVTTGPTLNDVTVLGSGVGSRTSKPSISINSSLSRPSKPMTRSVNSLPTQNAMPRPGAYRPDQHLSIDTGLGMQTSFQTTTDATPYATTYQADQNSSIDFDHFNVVSDQWMGMAGGNAAPFGDMLIESQDVDMSLLGLDMLPWLDASLGDMMPIFDPNTQQAVYGMGGAQIHHEPARPPQR